MGWCQVIVCPLCKTSSNQIWASTSDVEYQTCAETFQYFECTCGVIFLDNPPIDRLSEIYPSNYYSYSTSKHNLVDRIKSTLDRRFFAQVLKQVKGISISVLDVGGGSGYTSDAILLADSRVQRTTILDLDERLVSVLKPGPHDFICTRLEDFQTTQTFEFITLMNLIEHVHDPHAMMQKVFDLLTSGGSVVIQTPNYLSLDARILRNHDWGGLHAPRHWILFNQHSIHNLLHQIGFTNIKIQFTQGSPFWAVGITSFMQKIGVIKYQKRPLVERLPFRVALVIFAGFDMVRLKFGQRTSQMRIIASKS